MKVAELRKVLAKHKKEDLIRIAVEFYKAVPKAKKEDYGLDEIATNPQTQATRKSSSKKISLPEIQSDLADFIVNVRSQNYLLPNHSVPKKERSKWRFKVKRWYKELTDPKRHDADPALQTKLLSDLYEVLCESCAYQYFTAYDTFQSAGIEQITFYTSLIHFQKNTLDPAEFISKSILAIVNNPLNRYTLYSELMLIFIESLQIPDLKYKAIETAGRFRSEMKFDIKQYEHSDPYSYTRIPGWYEREKRYNNLVELCVHLYFWLYEFDNGINYFQKYFAKKDSEIKLYILIRILELYDAPVKILEVMKAARQQNVAPREALLELEDYIKEYGEIPH